MENVWGSTKVRRSWQELCFNSYDFFNYFAFIHNHKNIMGCSSYNINKKSRPPFSVPLYVEAKLVLLKVSSMPKNISHYLAIKEILCTYLPTMNSC